MRKNNQTKINKKWHNNNSNNKDEKREKNNNNHENTHTYTWSHSICVE